MSKADVRKFFHGGGYTRAFSAGSRQSRAGEEHSVINNLREVVSASYNQPKRLVLHRSMFQSF